MWVKMTKIKSGLIAKIESSCDPRGRVVNRQNLKKILGAPGRQCLAEMSIEQAVKAQET